MKARHSLLRTGAVVVTGLAGLVVAPAALAGPTHDLAIVPGASSSEGALVANVGDLSIRTTGPTGSGDRAGFVYCTPWPNSKVTGLYTNIARWHESFTGVMRTRGMTEIWRTSDASIPRGPSTQAAWRDGDYGACGVLELLLTGALHVHKGIWTAQVTRAKVEDLEGPAVGGVTAPTNWATGSVVPVSFDSSDNGLGNGGIAVNIAGAATLPGNLPTGRRTVNASLEGVPDGVHTITVSRTGHGWPTASSHEQVKVDRTPPAVPAPSPSSGAGGWTRDPVTIRTHATSDGAGSGWKENQFAINKGAWEARGETWTIGASGTHVIGARAVDLANHASAARMITVKIDRDAPVAEFEVDALGNGRAIVAVRASDGHSGVAKWELADAAGTTLATGDTTKTFAVRGLRGTTSLRLTVDDVAGNRRVATTGNIRFTPLPSANLDSRPANPEKAPNPIQIGVPRSGLAGATSDGSAPLPYWERRLPGLGIKRAYALNRAGVKLKLSGVTRRARVGGKTIPVVAIPGNKRARKVTGRFITGRGTPIPYAYVIVRDRDGVIRATATAGRRGSFKLTLKKRFGNRLTLAIWGRPERKFNIVVQPRAKLTTSLRKTTIRNRRLVVTGKMLPKKGNTRRLVQLQFKDDQGRWRPIVGGRTNARGEYRLRYRFTRRGGYTVPLRVVAPGYPGQPSLRTRPRLITVAP